MNLIDVPQLIVLDLNRVYFETHSFENVNILNLERLTPGFWRLTPFY